MPKTVDRVLVLGLDGATWTVLDPMRQRGLMPNLDALSRPRGIGHAAVDHPAGHDGGLDDHDDRLRAGAARRVRSSLLRRGRRADEGQPLRPDPRPDRLALALGHGTVDRLAQRAGLVSPAQGARNRRLGHGRAPPRGRTFRPLPSSPPGSTPRHPATAWATSGNGRRNRSTS